MTGRIHPLATGDSKPADPERPSFLRLPSEIRNHIYGLLLDSRDPIRVDCSPSWYRERCRRIADEVEIYMFEPKPDYVRLTHGPTVQLFMASRQVFREASTTYYSWNEFAITNHPSYRDEHGDFITGSTAWLKGLGSQAGMVRKVIIDLGFSCPWRYTWNRSEGRHMECGLLDFKPLLMAIWNQNLDIDISAVHSSYWDETGVAHYADSSPPTTSAGNATAITQVLRALLRDELCLKRYGRLLGSIGVRRDGSGSVLQWCSTSPSECTLRCDCTPETRWYPSYTTTFLSLGGDKQIRLQGSRGPAQFSDLPEKMRIQIIDLAISLDDPVKIDVGRQTGFGLNVLHLNKQTFDKYWYRFLTSSQFILEVKVAEGSTRLSDFSALRRILRKTFNPYVTLSRAEGSWLLEDSTELQLRLDFTTAKKADLEDLRINALPLVMETSSTVGTQKIFIQLCNTSSNRLAKYAVTLHELRFNVAKELMTAAFERPNINNKPCPEVWVNGFGVVVEVTTVSGPATDVKAIERHFAWEQDSEKGRRYRSANISNFATWRAYHPRYAQGSGVYFPFEDSTTEALHYLLWVLEQAGPTTSTTAPLHDFCGPARSGSTSPALCSDWG